MNNLNIYEWITLVIIGIVVGLIIAWYFVMFWNPKRKIEKKAISKILKQDFEFYDKGKKINLKDAIIMDMGIKEIILKKQIQENKKLVEDLNQKKKKAIEDIKGTPVKKNKKGGEKKHGKNSRKKRH